jgi:hypothetical protein
MTVYIVCCHSSMVVESVWNSLELAGAAIRFHCYLTGKLSEEYTIIEREVNTIIKKD